MALTDDDVREILRIIDESDLDELVIETDGFSLRVNKNGGQAGGGAESGAPEARGDSSRSRTTARRDREKSPPPSPTQPPRDKEALGAADGSVTVESPMLGTFYRAESPGAEPFVDVGSAVTADTTVCIIEVMKMMNSVPAGVTGTVAEILTENAALVEFGQPLLRIVPDE
jgi:acetyl-CoA carboxylase biotin carboxyl carrier protein